MHARRAGRVRLVEGRHLVGDMRRSGQLRETRPGHQDAEERPRLVDVDPWLLPECDGRGVREPIDQPALAEVVVDDQHAVRLEAVAHVAERLDGEHVALEPHAGKARLQRQRIDQREDDEVVLLRRRPQVVPGVVVDDGDARVGVRVIRMVRAAEPDDRRVDFHRVHVLHAVSERGGHVRAGPGAEDQDVLERVAEHGVRPLVEVFLLLDRRHRLVKDVVHLDDRIGPVLADGDLVVRRPDRSTRHDVDQRQRAREQRDVDADDEHRWASGGGDRSDPGAGGRWRAWQHVGCENQRQGGGEGQAEPHRRRQLEPRDHAERHDAGEAACQVDRVGLERRQLRHLASHPLRERGEERRHDDEEHRQEHRALDEHDLGRRAAREVDAAGGGDRHFEAEEIHRRDDRRLDEREPVEQPRARGASRHPMPMPRKLASRMKFEK